MASVIAGLYLRLPNTITFNCHLASDYRKDLTAMNRRFFTIRNLMCYIFLSNTQRL